MTGKASIIAIGMLVAATALPAAAQAQGSGDKAVKMNQCFVVMLSAWCPGIKSVTSPDTLRCVKKHWSEMGGMCQYAYSQYKP